MRAALVQSAVFLCVLLFLPDPALAFTDIDAGLLDALGEERAFLVAQSMGGWTALDFADGLIEIAGPPRGDGGEVVEAIDGRAGSSAARFRKPPITPRPFSTAISRLLGGMHRDGTRKALPFSSRPGCRAA